MSKKTLRGKFRRIDVSTSRRDWGMVSIGNYTPIQQIDPELWDPLEIAIFRTHSPSRDLYKDLGRGDTFVASQRLSSLLRHAADSDVTLLPIRLQSIDGEQECQGFNIVVPRVELRKLPATTSGKPSFFFCKNPFGLFCSEALALEIEREQFVGISLETDSEA